MKKPSRFTLIAAAVVLALIGFGVVFAAAGAPATGTSTPQTQPQGLWAPINHMTDANLDYVKQTLGYDFVSSGSSDPTTQVSDINRANAHGLGSMVWLGNYCDSNDSSCAHCTWRWTDAQVTAIVNAVKGLPGTRYYFVADEPHGEVGDACHNVVRRQILDRNALIKSLDPNHATLVSEDRTAAFATLANTSDVFIAIAYPCHFGAPCSTTNIPGRLSAMQAAGIQHFWGMREEFNEKGANRYYRYPSGADYTAQSAQWDTGGEEGELGFMGFRVYARADGIELAPQDLQDAVAARNGVP